MASQAISGWRSTASAILQTTAGQWFLLLLLIFGGCCSNAWALEWTTVENPRAGTLITLAQYLIVTLYGLRGRFTSKKKPSPLNQKKYDDTPPQTSVSNPPNPPLLSRLLSIRIKPLAVPISRWLIQVVLFLGVSLLNNLAFRYHVPMAVHIVFRSGGLVMNMVMGYLVQGKRYKLSQVLSVILVSLGIAAATTAGAKPKSASMASSSFSTSNTSIDPQSSIKEYGFGIGMLSVALILSTFLGLAQEKTYGKYGNHWEEGMFFLHFLALPSFVFMAGDLKEQIRSANASPRVSVLSAFTFTRPIPSYPSPEPGMILPPLPITPVGGLGIIPGLLPTVIQKKLDGIQVHIPVLSDITIPSFYIPLAINVITQLICVSGVNRLTARVSSLTVTLVLSLRKAVSLIISVVLIGGGTGSIQLWAGSVAVLIGTVLYTLSSAPKPKRREVSEEKKTQ